MASFVDPFAHLDLPAGTPMEFTVRGGIPASGELIEKVVDFDTVSRKSITVGFALRNPRQTSEGEQTVYSFVVAEHILDLSYEKES